MAITTRSTKGSALTHNEMDDNFNQVPNGADSSITDNGSGIDVTGTVTATSFSGDGSSLTNISSPLSFRNLIINGAMQVAQRGTSETGVTGSKYTTVDRFRVSLVALGTWTLEQSTDAPDTFSNSYKLSCTTADASLGSSDQVGFSTRIEAQDLQQLAHGTSNAKSMTLSFWVKSNKTGTYTNEMRSHDPNRIQCTEFTVSTADTWEKKIIYLDADTGGSGITNDNGLGLESKWWLGAGTNFTSGTLQTTWASMSTANRVSSNNVNLGDTVGNYFQITGVQLEVGSVATPFEHRSYGEELARCQRYYQYYGDNSNGAASSFSGRGGSNGYIVTAAMWMPCCMRTNPTVTWSGSTATYDSNSRTTGTPTSVSLTSAVDASKYTLLDFLFTYSAVQCDDDRVLHMCGTSAWQLKLDAEL